MCQGNTKFLSILILRVQTPKIIILFTFRTANMANVTKVNEMLPHSLKIIKLQRTLLFEKPTRFTTCFK